MSRSRLTVALVACLCGAPAFAARIGAGGPVGPLSSAGRWLTDATGRVVLLHGFNEVEKQAPYYPAAVGFGEDDAAFLAAEGFNALRLGVDFRGLMPLPGIVRAAYVEDLAQTVEALARRGIFVLLDFHQDGFAPVFNGNGFPDWMAITDGLPNPPDAVFPLYYVENPAMQRAFEHFWANDEVGGVGLQDYYVQGVAAVVGRFAHEPMVIGVELMNEPWPGATWTPCIAPQVGCPELEAQLLRPFYARGTAAARAIAPGQLVFVEPFVLFNFGQGPTSLPGTDPGSALSVHSYAIDPTGEEGVAAYAVAAAVRDGRPVVLTEFGATTDATVLDRLVAQFDAHLLPWMMWSYDELFVLDPQRPAGVDVLRRPEAFTALVRPYPTAVTGVPTKIAFDPATRVFDFEYDTARLDGGRWDRRSVTVVSLPKRRYPDGYRARVRGARVMSGPCASTLVLRNAGRTKHVSVRVVPRDVARGACAQSR